MIISALLQNEVRGAIRFAKRSVLKAKCGAYDRRGGSSGGIQRWQARGLDAVDRNLRAVYPNVLNLRLRDNEASYFDCFRLQLSDLTLHRTLTSGYSCRAEPNGAVRLTFPVRGTVTVASSRSRIVASEGRTASVCALEFVQRDVAAGHEGIHVQLTPPALLSRASILTGVSYDLEEISPSIELPLGGTLLSNVVGLMHEIERRKLSERAATMPGKGAEIYEAALQSYLSHGRIGVACKESGLSQQRHRP